MAIIFMVAAVMFLSLVPFILIAQSTSLVIEPGEPDEVSIFRLSTEGFIGKNWHFGVLNFTGTADEYWALPLN